jgi:hypothetical protein
MNELPTLQAMGEPLKHPATGELIELADGEQLWRIAWSGKPVLVITRTGENGEQLYRLAGSRGQTWNRVEPLQLEPWPPADAA